MNDEFVMPQPPVGQPVTWFRYGDGNRRHSELGFIYHVGARNCGLMTVSGRRLDAVRHADDPKLRLNADQRENGAWDYTPYHKQLEARLSRLERCLPQHSDKKAPAAKAETATRRGRPPKRKMPEGMRAFLALKKEASELGLEIPAGMKKPELEAALAEAREQSTELA